MHSLLPPNPPLHTSRRQPRDPRRPKYGTCNIKDRTPTKCCAKRCWETVPEEVLRADQEAASAIADTGAKRDFFRHRVYTFAETGRDGPFGALGNGVYPVCRMYLVKALGANNDILGCLRKTAKSGPEHPYM